MYGWMFQLPVLDSRAFLSLFSARLIRCMHVVPQEEKVLQKSEIREKEEKHMAVLKGVAGEKIETSHRKRLSRMALKLSLDKP